MSVDPTKTVDQERAERHARMAAAQQEANDIAAANRLWYAEVERAKAALLKGDVPR